MRHLGVCFLFREASATFLLPSLPMAASDSGHGKFWKLTTVPVVCLLSSQATTPPAGPVCFSGSPLYRGCQTPGGKLGGPSTNSGTGQPFTQRFSLPRLL